MSNSPQNIATFSLKSFKEKRSQIQESSVKKVTAPRKSAETDVVKTLIEYGKSATSGRAADRNKALNLIFLVYKNHKDAKQYLAPGSMWTFDQRFAVFWTRPDIPQIASNKMETHQALIKFHPVEHVITALGYSQTYQYSMKPTSPNRQVWTQYCIHGSKVFFEQIAPIKGWLYVPPQLPNMLQKLKENLSKPMKECPKEMIRELVNSSTCIMEEDISFFLTAEQNNAPIIKTVLDWMMLAHPHTATPGFPYSCMVNANGHSWGQITEGNDPLFTSIFSVIERWLVCLMSSLNKIKKVEDPMAGMDQGQKLYQVLYNQKRMYFDKLMMDLPAESGVSKPFYLLPHVIWTLSAGNVKPVSVDDIAKGKPDRSIFMSPGMIRLAYMRLSQMVSKHWKQSSKMTSFGWQGGGAHTMLEQLMTQVDAFDQPMEFMPQKGLDTYSVSYPKTCFVTPDIKSQDNHFHASFYQPLYQVLLRDFVLKVPKRYQGCLGAILGFQLAVETAPIILTNQNIFFYPKNLNVSGGPFTSIHSQNQSAIFGIEAKNFEWPYQIKVGHLSNGDDAIIALHSPQKDVYLGFRGTEIPNEKGVSRVPENEEVSKNLAVIEFGNNQWKGVKGFAAYIRHKYAVEFKPETLNVHGSLTAATYLGCNISLIPEDVYGVAALVAARPIHKIAFSVMWPKQHHPEGVAQAATAAMRAMSAYYDIAMVSRAGAAVMFKVYEYFKARAPPQPLDPKFYESDFFVLPKFDTFLPDLPPLPDIFEWMTGVPATTRSVESLDGEEFDGDFEDRRVNTPEQTNSADVADFETDDDFDVNDFEGYVDTTPETAKSTSTSSVSTAQTTATLGEMAAKFDQEELERILQAKDKK